MERGGKDKNKPTNPPPPPPPTMFNQNELQSLSL